MGVVHQYLEGKFILDFYIQKLSVLFRSSRFRKVEELTALFLSALTAVFKLDQVFQLKVSSVSATFASPVCVARSSDPFSGEGRGFLSPKRPWERGWLVIEPKGFENCFTGCGRFRSHSITITSHTSGKKDDPLTKPLTRMETF